MALALLAISGAWCAEAGSGKPNILFIVSDDLRTFLRCYGENEAHTPNLDRLAARGVLFQHAMPATPLCNPSRTAFLTGMRPSVTGVYGNDVVWSEAVPNAMTMPLFFKKNGYYVAGAGKIPHGGVRDSDWDDFNIGIYGKMYPEGPKATVLVKVDGKFDHFAWKEVPDAEEAQLMDYKVTSYVIDRLKQKRTQPFFLACGLRLPHVIWNAPKKYFAQYPLAEIKVVPTGLHDLDDVPAKGQDMALHGTTTDLELRAIPQGPEKVTQAYRASVSFMDAQVGRLLDALDASPARDNTIIVFCGDNGYNLGEKEHWGKSVLWKEATEVPFIVAVPGTAQKATICNHPVDLVSLFPTLCDLTGFPAPAQCLGPSLLPLLDNPAAPWSIPALTTMGPGNHAVCDDRWRYIRYEDGSEELYDREADPNEFKNLASNPEFAPIKERLAKSLPVKETPTKGKKTKGATEE